MHKYYSIVAFLFGALFTFVTLGQIHIDGTLGIVGETFFDDQSMYSAGYSEYNFRKVHVGMSKMDVLTLIGEPLEWSAYPPNKTIGYWSKACCGGNYKNRLIKFADDRVSQIIIQYYWD